MIVNSGLQAFLADPRNSVRRPPSHVPIWKVRQAANAAMMSIVGPELAEVRDLVADLAGRTVPIRLYRPTDGDQLPLIVFAHGGGWVWGNLHTHDAICRQLASSSGAAVLAVDYPLAPEATSAQRIDDVSDALRWAHSRAGELRVDADRLALCGDSAGGALALAAAIRAAEDGLPLGHLALIYPALDPACDSPSQEAYGEGYMLTRDAMRWFWECHLGDGSVPDDPLARPVDIPSEKLRALPPVTLAVAGFDILCHEGEAFAARLAEAGVAVRLRRYEGMIHGFLSVAEAAPTAARAIAEISTDLAESLAGATKEPQRA